MYIYNVNNLFKYNYMITCEIYENIKDVGDDETKYMFIDYDDNTLEVDIREVPDMKKAGLFIHKWDVPYDKPPKDGCGEQSDVNYMEFAKEHLK